MEPQKGSFKIQVVGPKKDIPNKKDPNRPWTSWDLQFEGDPNWYNTFWLEKETPVVGQELSGTKLQDEKWGPKFEVERQGGKQNWNPAGANATIMLAASNLVGQYLLMDSEHFELWKKKRKAGQTPMDHYLTTVVATAKLLKQEVVGMGGTNQETPAAGTANAAATNDSGDPGPVTPPPGVETYPGEEDVPI